MRKLSIAMIAAACLSLNGCGPVLESSFELAPESRLPKWFLLPAGLSRSEVSVTMNYYVGGGGRISTFTLLDVREQPRWPAGRPTGQSLRVVFGRDKDLQPRTLTNAPAGVPVRLVITVNGMTEVIEHR